MIIFNTLDAEVVEWQTRRTQNPLRDDLVRVQVPPSAPKREAVFTASLFGAEGRDSAPCQMRERCPAFDRVHKFAARQTWRNSLKPYRGIQPMELFVHTSPSPRSFAVPPRKLFAPRLKSHLSFFRRKKYHFTKSNITLRSRISLCAAKYNSSAAIYRRAALVHPSSNKSVTALYIAFPIIIIISRSQPCRRRSGIGETGA